MSKHRRGFHTTAPLLLRMGWLPMPLPAGKKKPPPKGFTGGEAEALRLAADRHAWTEEVRQFLEIPKHAESNTGVRLPDNVFALDVDDYENDKGIVKSGWENLAAFAESMGLEHPETSLPDTIRLTSRGYDDVSGQRFFRIPADLDVNETMDQLPGEAVKGVEILRPRHRYTIEAGSVHPNGGIYEVFDERRDEKKRKLKNGLGSISPEDLPEIPREWLNALVAAKPVTISESGKGGESAITSEARAEAQAMFDEWIEKHDLDVDDLTKEQTLSLLTVGARRVTLSFGEQSRNNANVSTACISLLATLIEDLGEEGQLPIARTIDIARNLYVRNGSTKDRPKEFDRAMVWAFPVAKHSVLTGDRAATLHWAQDMMDDNFWNQSEVLRSCRDFARSRLVSPDAMLACALIIVSSWMPPHIVLPGLVGDVAGLNFYVALAAASGGGKSAAMKAAKAWLNVRAHEDSNLTTDEPYVTTVSTAQGLVQAYTLSQAKPKAEQKHPGEMEHIQIRRSVRFEVDEIGALGAAMNAEGSMLKDFIKTMWTGSGVGTTAAEVARVRKLDDHEYRMSIIAGVQPSTADVILSGHGDGFPQRWLWVEAFDEAPLTREQWQEYRLNPPPALGWSPPEAPRPLDFPGANGDNKTLVRAFARASGVSKEFRVIEVTESFETKVFEAASGASRRIGDVDVEMSDVLDGHSVLMQEKLAALLAALHGEVDITPQFEMIAEILTGKSDATRAAILRERHNETMKQLEIQAKRQGRSDALVAESRSESEFERTADRILTELAEAGGSMQVAAVRKFMPMSFAGGEKELALLLEDLPGVIVEGLEVRIDLG